jgi:hypothetical protein
MDHVNRAHRALAAATVAALALVVIATAMAATAFKSGTYNGTLAAPLTSYTVSLKLNGSKLGPVKLNNIPFFCSSGGPPIPVSFPKTKISAAGAFKINATEKIKAGPLKGHVGEKLTISGTFTKNGTVHGRLKNVVTNAKQCNGSTTFTAKKS